MPRLRWNHMRYERLLGIHILVPLAWNTALDHLTNIAINIGPEYGSLGPQLTLFCTLMGIV